MRCGRDADADADTDVDVDVDADARCVYAVLVRDRHAGKRATQSVVAGLLDRYLT